MTNNAKVMDNNVKKVDEKRTSQIKMMRGYLEMAFINKGIADESFRAENEAEQTQYAFLGN